jgi:small subunit ribosomal protein S16
MLGTRSLSVTILMAVHIRLSRHGSKKRPYYRVVVTDQRNARDGRFIERVGTFDPNQAGGLSLDLARISYWKSQGAETSPTLERLVKSAGKA